MSRKHRQCPHCKGKTGFVIVFYRKGTITMKITWKGKLIDTEMEPVDDADHYVECLDCKKITPLENVEVTV